MNVNKKREGGFTLLELLIVVSIIAILSVALIFVLNPAETLKKSRDAQRISDLATLKTSIGLFLTSSSTPYMSGVGSNANCLNGGSSAKVYYSAIGTTATFGTQPTAGASANGTFITTNGAIYPASTNAAVAVDGTGWLPIDFTWLPGGSPISNLPLDPINTVTTPTAPGTSDLTYRYVCQSVGTGGAKPSLVFEMDAILESDAYKAGGTDDKPAKDGGDNTTYYEVGTNLKLVTSGL
ncbi:MAG: type II secretion system protein [Candidatus Yonathbacteria bacterium]|nr:type II secretion system protein [Candidatus Yonathbacteria bacterium]